MSEHERDTIAAQQRVQALAETLQPLLPRAISATAPEGAPGEHDAARQAILAWCAAQLEERQIALADDERALLWDCLAAAALGTSPIQRLLDDDTVTEILINSPEQIYVEQHGRLRRALSPFAAEDALLQFINGLLEPAGGAVGEGQPIRSVRLPDSSTLAAVARPISLGGPCLTIRKQRKEGLTLQDLLDFGSLTPPVAELLQACMRAGLSMIISGNVGGGKGTLVNILSGLLDPNERVVSVERVAELKLQHPHLITLESRPPGEQRREVTVNDLLRAAVSLRPERIITGDLDGPEVFDLLQIADTGYAIVAQMRGESVDDALDRVEMLVKFHRPEMPVEYLRMLTTAAIDVVVQQSRLNDGSRKVTEIAEVLPLRDGRYQLQHLARFVQTGVDKRNKIRGRFELRPISAKLAARMERHGLRLPPELRPPPAS